MKSRKLVLGIVFVMLGSSAAFAQSTLSELLAAKAVKLSQKEVTDVVSGATIRGATSAGGTTEVKYKADGTFTGTSQMSTFGSERGVSSGSFGKWTVDNKGMLCAEGTTSKGDKKFRNCGFLYRAGDRYYEAFGSKPTSPVLERTIKR
jgi:hypothetical protein